MLRLAAALILIIVMGTAPAVPISAQTSVSLEERLILEKELQEIEKQIKEFENNLANTEQKKHTLQFKINELKNRRARIELEIKATFTKLQLVNRELKQTEADLVHTLKKIDSFKNYLAEVLRLVALNDSYSPFTKLFSVNGLSEFFIELNELSQIQANINQSLNDYQELENKLDRQTDALEDKKSQVEHLLSIHKIQQQENTNAKTEQEKLLQETKGREYLYQQLIVDSKKRAAEIRSRIYELVGVQKQITFGEAVKIANWVATFVKIRPAFLLAVLSQESSLGKNVGTCNRLGDPPEKSWRVVMKPERDHRPFKEIIQELGLDIDTTPVSCPMKDVSGRKFGWGGAMGPAQFIPSTWQGYKKEVAAITGQPKANPWDIRDAFIAAALLLSRNGASGVEKTEWAAAMRYFSGSTSSRFRFYGDNVLARARQYEKDIADLQNLLTKQ